MMRTLRVRWEIAEDPGHVRVLATESIAGPTALTIAAG